MWTDASPPPPSGAWVCRVTAVDANGNEGAPSPEASTTTVGTEAGDLPTAFALSAPSPNPARGAATVRFALPVASAVRVTVYDVQGREVARLVNAEHPAGYHVASLSASRLAAGAYVVRMEADAFVATQRLTVVR